MIVKKYIVIGIKNTNFISHSYTTNNNPYVNSNRILIDYTINNVNEFTNTLFIDSKQFENKKEAINHINILKSSNSDIFYWSIMKIYVEINNELEIRRYKIKKLLKNIKKRN